MASHFGRPDPKKQAWDEMVAQFSLAPVAQASPVHKIIVLPVVCVLNSRCCLTLSAGLQCYASFAANFPDLRDHLPPLQWAGHGPFKSKILAGMRGPCPLAARQQGVGPCLQVQHWPQAKPLLPSWQLPLRQSFCGSHGALTARAACARAQGRTCRHVQPRLP